MTLIYTNHISTPSGRKCDLREIKNDEFFVLIKYAQAKNYKGFYQSLDSIVQDTVQDFQTYNIIDKAYVYLAICLFSVHNTIVTENTILGPIELSLVVLLDAIENTFSKLNESEIIDLTPTVTAEITVPTKLEITHEDVNIDYISGVRKIRDFQFESDEQRSQFISQIDTKFPIILEKAIKKEFSISCNLFNDVTVDLISPSLFYLIVQIYSEKLDDYYELLYYCFEYLKWSFDTFNKFTPLETRIMFNEFKIDKERQAQERENQ